jgi:pimeloyl-ACP methyl ester carboxylesterase
MRQRLREIDVDAVRARFQGLHDKDLARKLAPAQMPCLIYVGEDESAYGGAKQLAGLLPDAEFVAYPDFNHYDMLSQVDVILPDILRFLSKG